MRLLENWSNSSCGTATSTTGMPDPERMAEGSRIHRRIQRGAGRLHEAGGLPLPDRRL